MPFVFLEALGMTKRVKGQEEEEDRLEGQKLFAMFYFGKKKKNQ